MPAIRAVPGTPTTTAAISVTTMTVRVIQPALFVVSTSRKLKITREGEEIARGSPRAILLVGGFTNFIKRKLKMIIVNGLVSSIK
jgi:hypothetical protein